MWALLDFWENSQGTGAEVYKFKASTFKHVSIPPIMSNGSLNMHLFSDYQSKLYRFNGLEKSVSVFHEGRWLRVNMIHFQGGSKQYVHDFHKKFSRALEWEKEFNCKIKRPSKTSVLLKKCIGVARRKWNALRP